MATQTSGISKKYAIDRLQQQMGALLQLGGSDVDNLTANDTETGTLTKIQADLKQLWQQLDHSENDVSPQMLSAALQRTHKFLGALDDYLKEGQRDDLKPAAAGAREWLNQVEAVRMIISDETAAEIEKCSKRITGKLRRRWGNDVDVDNAVGEAVFRLTEALSTGTEVEKIDGYLYRSANNLLINEHHSGRDSDTRQKWVTSVDRGRLEEFPDKSAGAFKHVLTEELHAIFKKQLTEKEQNIYDMYYIDGMTAPEIASKMVQAEGGDVEKKGSAITSAVSRIKKKLNVFAAQNGITSEQGNEWGLQ